MAAVRCEPVLRIATNLNAPCRQDPHSRHCQHEVGGNADFTVDWPLSIGKHPASLVHQLTPRIWKETFANNPLQSDLHEMDGGEMLHEIDRLQINSPITRMLKCVDPPVRKLK
ncbi:MAG TPA: hypothetical protein VF472_13190 [Burkholderiaceae bacterium]